MTKSHPARVLVDRLMTVQQVAERLAVSHWTVYRLIKNRGLTSVCVGRARRVLPESVDAYLTRLIEEAA